MANNDLISDQNYLRKCRKYGIDSNKYFIVDNTIVINSPKENILVLFDENYNTIGIYNHNKNTPLDSKLSKIREIKNEYENTTNKLPYPFQNLSLKQIVDLSNRIYLEDVNHGHSSHTIVNGQRLNDDDNYKTHTDLLSYIRFIGVQVEEYFINLYRMKLLGLSYPSVYDYITALMKNINECIDINIKDVSRTQPYELVRYIGFDFDDVEIYKHELYDMINLLCEQRGFKCGYPDIKPTNTEPTNLIPITEELLKILEVTNEEVEARYQEANETFHIENVELKDILSGNKKLEKVNKD